MAVRIRLRRTGKRNAPSHRIVVADGRSPRDGRFIETIGVYDPRKKAEQVDLERVDYWVSHGAQPSETVSAIIKRVRAGVPLAGKQVEGAAAPKAEEAATDVDDEATGEAADADADAEDEEEG